MTTICCGTPGSEPAMPAAAACETGIATISRGGKSWGSPEHAYGQTPEQSTAVQSDGTGREPAIWTTGQTWE
ncbi:MAG: hypothetical protein OXD37_02150 [Acidimicrobiaceae bacterium]|nr:hypothetical protein [Acidimicrobiaceae bacterium]